MGTCEQCGSPLTKPALGRPQTRFCSKTCKETNRSDAQKAERRERRARLVCAQCQQPVPATRGSRATTCSKSCSTTYQNRVRQEAKRAAWEATKPPCGHCKGEIPSDRHAGSVYCSPECKRRAMAANWRARWPDYMRRYLYGLSPEQYQAMMIEQDGRCAICCTSEWGGRSKKPNVDHDHVTGKVRGLLCEACNLGLGKFGDDPERVRAAAAYLEAHTST